MVTSPPYIFYCLHFLAFCKAFIAVMCFNGISIGFLVFEIKFVTFYKDIRGHEGVPEVTNGDIGGGWVLKNTIFAFFLNDPIMI